MAKTKKATALKRPAKARVNLFLDRDVIEYFKGRANAPGAAGYQTQINAELRAVMEGGGGPFASLVDDEAFIAAVAEQVRRLARRGRKG
jgi:hypothetical protein